MVFSANKECRLSEVCKREHCHCLSPHETHRSSDYTRPNIAIMTIVVESPHNKHGGNVFVRKDLKINIISVDMQGIVELIIAKI